MHFSEYILMRFPEKRFPDEETIPRKNIAKNDSQTPSGLQEG